MPLSKEEAKIRAEDLRLCTIGHEVVKDAYMEGVKKHLGRRAFAQVRARRKVRIWILMFLTRQPKEVL